MNRLAAAFALVAVFSSQAFAAPADDARTHVQAIGSGVYAQPQPS